MESEKTKTIKRNVIFGIFNQILIFTIGLIVPRFILTSYGSEINGLLTTVIQIFTYVGLLEAGIGNASLNALYKPFAENNQYDVCDVFSATQKYFRKITLIYTVCVFAVALIYPLCISCELSYIEIFLVIAFQGLSGALTFFFVAAYKQVLMADGKNYVVSNISLIIYILTSVTKIALMGLGFNVVFLQMGYFFVHCTQILLFAIYMNKKYSWLKKHRDPNMKALSQRKAFFIHELSGVVFSSTDAFVLSTFCSLMITSIYSVYNMVFAALNSLITSVSGGLHYILGQSYNTGNENYPKIHDTYDSLYMAFTFALFSVTYVLICPFVRIYTQGVTDIEYIDYLLPIFFVAIQLLSCSRATSARLITISGHAKATQWRSLIEAVINLTISIILVNFIGIYGVLVGTIIALLYRSNDIIIYANKKILKRSPWKTYRKVLLNFLIFLLFVFAEFLLRDIITLQCNSFGMFVLFGFVLTVISFLLYFGAVLIANPSVKKLVMMKLKRTN